MRAADLLRRFVLVAAGIALAGYAVQVTHDFYAYVDHSIFVSVDDSEANIAYAIAAKGSYGFPASPVLAGQDRSRYQFNYGPWYFYLAGALSWLFGFSLTLVRSIHLWGVLAMIGMAAWWFAGRDRMAATLLFGLGILYSFEAAQWPMARPDILVSVFAVALVMAAGAGLQRLRPLAWFAAGLAATCGAFTHLIAFMLVPSACVLFVVAAALELRESADRRLAWRAVTWSLLGFAAGGIAGLVMFYGSFGFQIGVQYRFLTAYRELTASPVSASTALGHHLTYAFGYLSNAGRIGVWLAFAGAWLVPVATALFARSRLRLVCGYLLPPIVVWTGYLASSGYYTNYHQGYSLLHQVLFLWIAAALGWLTLWAARTRFPTAGALLAGVVLIALVGQTARLWQWQRSGESWKTQRIETWVAFAEYSDRVLKAIPARATAWGSIILGLEAPDRIQLVQWSDAAGLFTGMTPSARSALVPDYLVWAYPEVRDNMLSVTRGHESLLFRTSRLLGDTRMRVVSLVAGAPYGVTRTYARRAGDIAPSQSPPAISVYDPSRRRWLTRMGAPLATPFTPLSPVALNIGYEAEPPTSTPAATVAADLPADRYVLRVEVRPGAATPRRLLAATSINMVRQTIGEGGPAGDFVSYLDDDRQVFMVIDHSGGPLYVSQFDDGAGAALGPVVAFPIIGLLDPAEQPKQTQDLPKLAAWTTVPGVTARPDGAGVRVTGDNTAGGYQLVSPRVAAFENNRVTVRMPLRVERGRVCAGVLNGSTALWLVPPDTVRAELSFTVDATQGFHVVLANCNSAAGGAASEFIVWEGDYFDDPIGTTYADRLVAAALYPAASADAERAGPEVRTVPTGLVVTKGAVDGPVEPLLPADLDYRAPVVNYANGTWSLEGTADGAFTYALQSKPRRLEAGSRLLISGRVAHGGMTVGLLKDNQWAAQINVTDPGDFTVVIAPPGRGTYTIVIAHNLPKSLETSIAVTRFGMLPPK